MPGEDLHLSMLVRSQAHLNRCAVGKGPNLLHLSPSIACICRRTPIDRILCKYTRPLGIWPGYSAHSMRATFITTTTALNNRASLEDVQRDVGLANPSTTKLYDRRGHNPEKPAAFIAT
jgi:integrase